MLLHEIKELDEGKWDYDQASKGKGAGWSQQGDGGAKNRKQRKAFRKAEKKKKHQAMMRGEKWAQEKEVDEGFKSMAKGAAFAALAATAMSGTYGYDKLLRSDDPDEIEVSQEATAAYHHRQQRSKARLLALVKRAKAKRMNPKASKQENMVQSGSYPSDAVAGSGSTTHGSRYQASQSSVND